MLCRSHNRHAAEKVFGRAHIEERIHLRRSKCGTGDAPKPTKEVVRGALRRMGFRSAEADRAVAALEWGGDGLAVETLVRDALAVLT